MEDLGWLLVVIRDAIREKKESVKILHSALVGLVPVMAELSPALRDLGVVTERLNSILTDLMPTIAEPSPALRDLGFALRRLVSILADLTPAMAKLSYHVVLAHSVIITEDPGE